MIKRFLKGIIPEWFRARYFLPFYVFIKNTRRNSYPHCGQYVDLNGPLYTTPECVTLHNFTRLQNGTRIITAGGEVVIKQFTAVGAETLIIPGSHTPTVGLPQYLSTLHINDTETTIEIAEDCWIGARSILLSHARVGRGAVVAAGTTVTKEVPPYAVVAGSPAKIIAARFTVEQILAHEQSLYPPEERFSRQQLDELFATHFEGKRTIGTDAMSDEDRLVLRQAKAKLGMTDYAEQ